MTGLEDIHLPHASKYLISLILSRGGSWQRLKNTDVYVVEKNSKEYFFAKEFTPLTPYMFGILFTNQSYWFEVLKDLKLKTAWKPKKRQQRFSILMTKDGFYNIVRNDNSFIAGDGKSSLQELLMKENLRRVNAKGRTVFPIKVIDQKENLSRIVGRSEKVVFPESQDYTDVTLKVGKQPICLVKKIQEYFPGLEFLCLEIFMSSKGSKQKIVVGKVSVSPGINIFFPVTNGKVKKNPGKLLVKAILA